jgi:hypothetical protein
MSARTLVSRYDINRAGTATRSVHHARSDSGLRPRAPGDWVSESNGLDSRLPDMPTKNGAGIEQFAYEKVSVEEAKSARSGGGSRAAPGISSRSRRYSPPEPLQDVTVEWLAQLPKRLRPQELARQFPRIANKLCGLWADPVRCNGYLTELLMDTRDGTREGFPMVVAAEIAALLGSVDTSVKDGPWGQIKGTR